MTLAAARPRIEYSPKSLITATYGLPGAAIKGSLDNLVDRKLSATSFQRIEAGYHLSLREQWCPAFCH